MTPNISTRSIIGTLAVLGLVCSATAFSQQAPRVSLFPSYFKVEWKQPASQTGQVPVVQDNVADPNLELNWYGPAAKQLLTSGTPGSAGRPFSVWSGEAEGPFAITFMKKDHYVDLTGLAKMQWTVKTSGFHVVRPVVKLADGTLLVGDHSASSLPMMTETEFTFEGVRWMELDPDRVVTINNGSAPAGEIWVDNPDLSRVEEVGFADLMPASGHGSGGYIHLGSIEVFGTPVPR